ncbi:hypothetical protein Bca4012_102562 [Brassica carinata]
MIGRADIEGSKSSVAMSGLAATSQLSLIKRAFTLLFHEISVLVELILGHLRYLLTDVPPQPNSPPDNVLRRIDREASLGSKEGVVTRLRFTDRIPLVRTSSELAVRRGKARKSRSQSVPGRHEAVALATLAAQAARQQSAGWNWDPEPSPRANPFRSYGSILPTSLAYIVPSTRGCSPWRPDAVMSATGRGGFRSSVFKGAGMHGHHAACGALPAAGPYLRLSRFRSGQAICTGGAPPGSRPRFCSDRAPSYSSRPGSCPAAGIGRASAPSISGLVDSAGNRRNQLLDGSISLSPLYPSQASDLRQYRCGPPPEFPLAARSGIVHHLSGPDSMLTLEPFSEDQGRSAVHREDQPISFPYALRVYSPVDSHTCQTPWSVFQGGSNGSPQAAPRARRCEARRGALGRNLPPDWGCIPKQPDFVDSACVVRQGRTRQGSHPLWRPFPGTWARSVAEALLRTTIRARRRPIFKLGSSRVIRLTWGRVEDFGSSRAFGRSGGDLASEFTTACQGAPGILSSDFGQRRAVTRETSFRPISSRGLGAAICDTQAGVPSARRLEAQLAFKDFDGSRDSAIHTNTASNKHRLGLAKAGCLVECSLTLLVRGLVISGSYAYNPAKLGGGERITTESVSAKSAKIPAHE